MDLMVKDKHLVSIKINFSFHCNQNLSFILNAIISHNLYLCIKAKCFIHQSGDVLGIKLMKARFFVQQLAACTGFCGNGIGISVLEY